MAREAPGFIPLIQIRSVPVGHPWDDDDPYEVLPAVDEDLQERFLEVTDLAKAAFVIACAEWVAWRFADDPASRIGLDYAEAAWARLIDPSLGEVWEPDDWDDWLGPVRGPVATAMLTITNAFASVDEGAGGELEAAFAASLARHVLPENAGFLAWQERAVSRLEQAYRMDPADPTGPAVPREAVDPNFELTEETAESALDAFLGSLDPEGNEFLVARTE